jgi:hypothetical protein
MMMGIDCLGPILSVILSPARAAGKAGIVSTGHRRKTF